MRKVRKVSNHAMIITMPEPAPNTLFSVTVFNYEHELFSGEVTSFSGHNEAGPFDILGDHANFISVLDTHLELQLPNGEQKSWEIESGVVRCFERQVSAYLVLEKAHERLK